MTPGLSFKPGVKLTGICPQINTALIVASQVYAELGYPCTVTSANDSQHSTASLHYAGSAVDLRTQHMGMTDQEKQRAAQMMRDRLTTDYDIILEEIGSDQEHIHVEWQPKRRLYL